VTSQCVKQTPKSRTEFCGTSAGPRTEPCGTLQTTVYRKRCRVKVLDSEDLWMELDLPFGISDRTLESWWLVWHNRMLKSYQKVRGLYLHAWLWLCPDDHRCFCWLVQSAIAYCSLGYSYTFQHCQHIEVATQRLIIFDKKLTLEILFHWHSRHGFVSSGLTMVRFRSAGNLQCSMDALQLDMMTGINWSLSNYINQVRAGLRSQCLALVFQRPQIFTTHFDDQSRKHYCDIL